MRRLVLVFGVAVLALWGQKIETRKAGDNRIFKLGTALDHLSVIELGEPVLEVAAGSPAFKIEWRENKVFVQPLEPEASTNRLMKDTSSSESCASHDSTIGAQYQTIIKMNFNYIYNNI